MRKMRIEFEISEESFDLLKRLEKEKYLEYRDTEYLNIDEFKDSEEFKSGLRSIQWFMNRNSDGTYYLIEELLKHNLVDCDDWAWHQTYVLTDFGKEVLKNHL